MPTISKVANSWREAFSVYSRRPVITMFFLGFSAGLPFLLVFSTLTAWLTDEGITKSTIGFFSWIGITYSIKVFWAPIVDKLRLPVLCKWFGQRRSWILLAQLGIAFGLFLMAETDPGIHIERIAFFGVLVAFSSATQDISIDAYRIEAAIEEYQAAMSATYVFGYRVALLVGGAGALYLAQYFSWTEAYLIMAVLVGVGIVAVLVSPTPENTRPSMTHELAQAIEKRAEQLAHLPEKAAKVFAWFTEAVVGPFVDFFRRYGKSALLILLLVSVYRISDITMGVMANPFYLDMGFSKVQIADVTKVFGFVMTILGSVIGGILVTRYGIARILFTGAVLVASTNLLFAWMGTLEPDIRVLALVVSADNLSGGLAVVAFIAFLSSLTSTDYTATQYALFSSLMTLPGKFFGGFSGMVVDAAGYTQFFVLASIMGIPAILLALWFYLQSERADSSAEDSSSEEVDGKSGNTKPKPYQTTH